MSFTTGILLFDGVDELDVVGPLDVLSYASHWGQNGRVFTIGLHRGLLSGANGLRFEAAHTTEDAPPTDLLIVPGGRGTDALARDTRFLEWLRKRAESAHLICSVCTGSFVLQAAGLTHNRRITTHRARLEDLRSAQLGEVVEGVRYVADGNIVTAAGVSAGIDMALWVVGQLYGDAHARWVRSALNYEPEPPY